MGRTIVIPSGAGAGGGITNINVSAGTTSNNLSNITFANSPTVSFGLDGSTITASAAGGGGGLTNIRVSAGTTSNLLSAITFADSNGLAFGINASTITGSYTQSNQNAVGSNGNFNFQTISFSNANGLSFGTSAGSAIFGSYTVPTVTNSSWTVSDAATSGTVARLAFTNLNGVTLSLSTGAAGQHTIVGSHNALTSQSNQAFSAQGGSSAFQTLGFSDNAYLSWTNTNGSVAVTEIRGSFFATGNTTQSSSNTINLDTVIFRGSGAASVGVSNGSIIVDVAAGAAAVTQSVGISTQTAGGATAGTSGYATGDDILYHFVPGSNITMSQSLNGASATLTIYGTSGGGGGAPTMSLWANVGDGAGTATNEPNFASLYVYPLAGGQFFPGNMSVNTMFMEFSGTVSTGAGFTRSLSLGFYTLVNSTQLSLAFSASTTWGTGAANMLINDSMAGIRWVTFHSSQFNNAPNFSQTNYWMGLWQRSSSGSQTFGWLVNTMGFGSGTRSGFMNVGSDTATSQKFYPFRGNYSASISTAMPNALAASDIAGNAAQMRSVPIVWFNNVGSNIV